MLLLNRVASSCYVVQYCICYVVQYCTCTGQYCTLLTSAYSHTHTHAPPPHTHTHTANKNSSRTHACRHPFHASPPSRSSHCRRAGGGICSACG